MGGDSTADKLRGLFLALLMVTSVAVQPVGADVLAGGVANTPTAGNSPSVVINDATIDSSTESQVQVGYNVSGTGQNPANLSLALIHQGQAAQLDGKAPLTSQSGVVNLTIPSGIQDNFTAVVKLVNESSSTTLAQDSASVVVKEDGSDDGPEEGLPPAPYVNASDGEYSSSSDRPVYVEYNASGLVSQREDLGVLAFNVTDGNGTKIAANTTLWSLADAANVTLPAGSLLGNVTVEYRLVNTTDMSVLATDTANYTDLDGDGGGGGGGNTAPYADVFAPSSVSVGQSVELNASVSTDFDGSITSYDWTVTKPDSSTTTLSGEVVSFTPSQTGEYTVQLTLTDDDGATNTTTVAIDVSQTPVVVSSDVSYVSGTQPSMNDVQLDAFFSSGLLQVQVKNATADFGDKDTGPDYELAGVGADRSTVLQINVTFEHYVPRVLIGTAHDVNWTRTQNAPGNWTVTITGSPAEVQSYFDSSGNPPSTWNGSVKANTAQNQSMTFAVDDLGIVSESYRERMNGTVMMTDAQTFGSPRYNASATPDRIELSLSAPHYTTQGVTNEGFFEAYLPPSLLSAWGVSPSQLVGKFAGQTRATSVTATPDGGARVNFSVHYSQGDAAVTYNESGGGDGGGTGDASKIVVDGDADADDDPATIQAGIDAASDGDTVVVRPGVYSESLTIDKNITLAAPDGATLNGSALSGNTTAISVTTDSADIPRIMDLTITGYTEGINASGAQALVVHNVTITDIVAEGDSDLMVAGHGIYADGLNGFRITDTVVRHVTGDAIQIDDSQSGGVRGSDVQSADGHGILFANVQDASILGNDVVGTENASGTPDDSDYGITVVASSGSVQSVKVADNRLTGTFSKKGGAVNLWSFAGETNATISEVSVRNNYVAGSTAGHPESRGINVFARGNDQYGTIGIISKVRVENNTVRDTTSGAIGIAGGNAGRAIITDVDVTENDIADTGKGITVVPGDAYRVWNIRITRNDITNTEQDGIQILPKGDSELRNVLVRKNTVIDANWAGVAIVGIDGTAEDLDLVENNVTQSKLGVFVDASDKGFVSNIDIVENYLSNNTKTGVLVGGKANATVRDVLLLRNLITDNGVGGVYLDGETVSATTKLDDNDIRNNDEFQVKRNAPLDLRHPDELLSIGRGDDPQKLGNGLTTISNKPITFDKGSNYEVRLRKDGEVVLTAVVTETFTLPADERFAFRFHNWDGSVRDSPVISSYFDGESHRAGLSILNGSVPTESGLANYSLRLVNASTGEVIDSTEPAQMIFDYRGELNASVDQTAVTLSIPRSSIPTGVDATVTLSEPGIHGESLLTKELTYDSTTDTYRVEIPKTTLRNGTYGYDVSFHLPGGGKFDVSSLFAGELVVGGVTISGTITDSQGSPVSDDAVVSFVTDGEFRLASTNASGGFSLATSPGTEHTLVFYQGNASKEGGPEPVKDGIPDFYVLGKGEYLITNDTTVDQTLPEPYVLNVTVVDEGGDPVDENDVAVNIFHNAGPFSDTGMSGGIGDISMRDGRVVDDDGVAGLELRGNVSVLAQPTDPAFADQTIQRNLTVTSDTDITITLPKEDQEPTVRLTTNRSNLIAGETVLLDASKSRDNGEIVGANWTMTAPDGTTTQFDGPFVRFTPEQSGEYEVSVTIRDAAGNTNTTTTTFTTRVPADVTYDYELQNVVAGEIAPSDALGVRVTVTNDGDLTAERTVALRIDGNIVAEKTVTLGGGESTTVSFTRNVSTGTHNVTINELPTRTFEVVEPANLTVSYEVSDTQLFTSDPLAITATVTNDGGVEGTRQITFDVAGQTITETVTVPSDANRTVTVTEQFQTTGTKIVGVENQPTTAVQVQRATNANATTTITSPASGTTTDATTLTLQYSVSNADTGIAGVVYRVDGGSWVNVTNGLGSSSVSVDLSSVGEGDHTITLALRDNLGNVLARSDVTITIDRTAPTAATSISGSSTVGPESTVTVDVTASDATLNVSNATLVDSGTVVETVDLTDRLADGQATVTVDTLADDGTTLSSGTYTLRVNVTDEAGHLTQKTTTVTVDTDAPSLSGLSIGGGTTDGGQRYLNSSATFSLTGSISDSGASSVDNLSIVFVSQDQSFNHTYRTSIPFSGSFTQSFGLAGRTLPEGNYSVVVRATDAVGNERVVENVGTFVYDDTAPTLGVSVVAQDATTGKVIVTSDEALSSAPTVDVQLPDGTNKTVTVTKQSKGRYTGTFDLGKNGEYVATASGSDATGNADSATSKTNIQTNIEVKNRQVTIETGDGSFIRLKLTTDDIDGALASLTSSDTPLATLGKQLTGSQFIEGELGSKLSNNLSYALIGIPRSDVTLPPGISASQIEIRRYNESQNRWKNVGTTTVESKTVNGTTDTYFVVNVSHFSTYGAVSADQNPPTIDSTTHSPTEPSDGSYAYSTDTVTTTVSYSDDVSGVNASAVTVTFDGTPVSQVAGVTADVTDSEATITATGLTGSGSHTVTVTVEDESGKTTTTSSSFTVAQDTSGPSLSTSFTDGKQLAYGTTSETIRVDYTDALSGVNTSTVTVKVDGTTLPDAQTTVDDGFVEFTVDDLQAGDNPTVEVSVSDEAGNTETLTRQFSVATDDSGPTVTNTAYDKTPVSTGPTEFAPTTTQVTTTLSITDALSGVDPSSITVKFGPEGSLSGVTGVALVTDSKVEYTGTNLKPDTTYVLQVTLADGDGNTRTVERTFTVRPDTTAPSVTATSYSASDGDTSPSFDNGVDSVDVTLSVTDNLDAVDTSAVTVEFGPSGNLKDVTSASAITSDSVVYTASDLENDTTYELRVTLVDDAGNTRTVTREFDIGSGSAVSTKPPSAALSAPSDATAGETVTLDASASSDNVGISMYRWDFDDDGEYEARTTVPTVTHTFSEAGQHTVTVKVSDGAGLSDTTSTTVTVTAADDGTGTGGGAGSGGGSDTGTASLSVTSASLTTQTLTLGESTTVTATVENTGDASGTTTISVTVDGETVTTKTVELDAGEQTTVELSVSPETAGESVVSVSGTLAGTLTVQESSDSETDTSTETAADETPTETDTPTEVSDDETPTETPEDETPTETPEDETPTETDTPTEVSDDETPTETDTPTEMSDDETPTATATETSTSFPGFTPSIAVIALLAAALLALRKRE
jgi:PGF-CTERM protein